MSILAELSEAIKKGKNKDAEALTQQALDQGSGPQDVLNALTSAMDEIGAKFKNNEIFVPEVLIAARAMKTAMGVLEPVLAEAGITPEHKIVLGTVKGDLHDIGKNLVGMMLKGANFDVVDVGVDVSPEKFVEAVKESGAGIVAMSALLTTTMPAMKETIDALQQSGVTVKTMIGGAPVTQEYADQIGASGYSADAASAVDLARNLTA